MGKVLKFVRDVWKLREYRATWLVLGASGANEYTISFIKWGLDKAF